MLGVAELNERIDLLFGQPIGLLALKAGHERAITVDLAALNRKPDMHSRRIAKDKFRLLRAERTQDRRINITAAVFRRVAKRDWRLAKILDRLDALGAPHVANGELAVHAADPRKLGKVDAGLLWFKNGSPSVRDHERSQIRLSCTFVIVEGRCIFGMMILFY